MKKQIIRVFTILSIVVVMQSINFAQAIATSYPGQGPEINGNCIGSNGGCHRSMTVISSRNSENEATFAIYQSNPNTIVIKYPKSLMDSDMKTDFNNRAAYFLEQPQTLDISVQEALKSEKPIVLAKGWHHIIDWQDCFYISFTIEK
jgi:hypothetical protein